MAMKRRSNWLELVVTKRSFLKVFCLLQLTLIMDVPNCASAWNQLNICPSEIKNPEYDGFRYKNLKIARADGEFFGRVVVQDVCYVIFHKSALDGFVMQKEGSDSVLISEFCNTKFRSSSGGQTSILKAADSNAKKYIFNEWAKKHNNDTNIFLFYHEGALQDRIESMNPYKQVLFGLPSQRFGKVGVGKISFKFELIYSTTTKFFGETRFQSDTMAFGFYDSLPTVNSDLLTENDYLERIANGSYNRTLPWCRDVIVDADKKKISLAEDFYTCDTQRKWEWFTCAFKPYNHCIDKQKRLCGWKPDVLKCTEYSYDRIQEREEPYGKECSPRDYGEPCSPCKTCETTLWEPWRAWTGSCGNVTRKRYRPPDGESHIDCSLDDTDCCHMTDWKTVPCPVELLPWEQKEKVENPIAYFLLIPATFALILCVSTLYMVFKSRKPKVSISLLNNQHINEINKVSYKAFFIYHIRELA
ncbi:hypothetical protein TTRE_0000232201 [Trichuris trichiura]|uniref:Uncharacterized protein n=1 Tax=Trichuris trichiura TaxID=36087 RepID=A0A077Z2Y0_TRITR|nr:hypothetical protein TTRE_0000232201 [Trichuris trichiura]